MRSIMGVAVSTVLVTFLIAGTGCTQNGAVPLIQEQDTTVRVGQSAVLLIPTDSRYDSYADSKSGIGGAWRNVLKLVNHSRRRVTFSATRTGRGVLLLSPAYELPDDPNCVSCATIHYFVKVIPANGG